MTSWEIRKKYLLGALLCFEEELKKGQNCFLIPRAKIQLKLSDLYIEKNYQESDLAAKEILLMEAEKFYQQAASEKNEIIASLVLATQSSLAQARDALTCIFKSRAEGPSERVCCECKQKSHFRCSCLQVRYCSAVCQKNNWPEHQKNCKSAQ